MGLAGRSLPLGKLNEPPPPPLGGSGQREGGMAVRDLVRRLRVALRVPVPAPEGLGWLWLAGALAAFLPFLLERTP